MSMEEFNYWIAFHAIENEKASGQGTPSSPRQTGNPKVKEWVEVRTPATFENDVSTAMKKRGIALQSGYNF